MNLTLTTQNTLSISVSKDELTINFQPDFQGAVALTVSSNSSEAAVALAKPF